MLTTHSVKVRLPEFTDVGLDGCLVTLEPRVVLPYDVPGFSMLQLHGGWMTSCSFPVPEGILMLNV